MGNAPSSSERAKERRCILSILRSAFYYASKGGVEVDHQEAIRVIKANYPPENYTMLRAALDLAIKILSEKDERK